MSAIAGCTPPGIRASVVNMLNRMKHRGRAGRLVLTTPVATLGVAWTPAQELAKRILSQEQAAQDAAGSGRLARATADATGLSLLRDPLGVAPLYYGVGANGALYFASEVKALLPFTREIRSVSPGHVMHAGATSRAFFRIRAGAPLTDDSVTVAMELRRRLTEAVRDCVDDEVMGCWLSGGLNSSALAALAAPLVPRLHTFTGGLPDAPNLEAARAVARFIRSRHHQLVFQPEELLAALPDVIYHLESFDVRLVRSSVINFLVGRAAAGYTQTALCGEGGDEMFAGPAHGGELKPDALDAELVKLTRRLSNTSLQRVDRCSAAHGLLAHLPFLQPDLVDYALRIPAGLKLRDGVSKWILRQAVDGLIPDRVQTRTEDLLWEGADIGELFAECAAERISDRDFHAESALPNGWRLKSKEELMYYRIFKERFGELEDLDWMGRTAGVPNG